MLCHESTGKSGLINNGLLWSRLGLNRAVGGPHISSQKKKGESTVYFIKLPPQPHYYIPINHIKSYDQPDKTKPFKTVKMKILLDVILI